MENYLNRILNLENKITLTSIGDNKKLSFGASVLEDLNESGNDKYEYLVPNIKYNFFLTHQILIMILISHSFIKNLVIVMI